MSKRVHTCTGCVPIDVSIIDTYVALTKMLDSGRGPAGESAYQIAVDNGFVGTEEEWLASLNGTDGADGDPAGFGTVSASVGANTGTPSVTVTTSGPDTAKNISFAFDNIKGDPGQDGDTIKAVSISVDNGVGTPSASAEYSGNTGGVLSFQFHNLKGERGIQGDKGDKGDQGNTGSSVDYPFELVNNETTDDPNKAHTAAGAKRLKDEVTQLALEAIPLSKEGVKRETVSSLTNRNYSTKTDGTYGTDNSYKHSLVSVKPGSIVKITAPSSYTTRVCFVTSTASPTSGGSIPLCSGTTVVELSAGTERTFAVPSDAVAFLVYRGNSPYNNTPSSIVITKPALNPDGVLNDSISSDPASLNLVSDAVFNGADYDAETIDLSVVPSQSLSIDVNNAFESTGTHGLIYVEPDDVLKVTGGGGRAAFVYTISCPESGSTVAVIETMKLESGKVYFLRAPSTPNAAQGFIFNTDENGTAVSPSAIVRYTPVERTETTVRRMYAQRFSVSGGALIYAAYSQNRNALIKVKAGRTYVLEFTSDASSQILCFIEDLPYIGLSATSVSFTINANYVNKKLSITLTPSSDGYYLFRFNKSGGPTYTVNAYDVTDVQTPVSDIMPDNVSKFWRYDVYALTKRSYAIADNGCYASSTSYKHCLIPVTAGQYVKVVKGAYSARLAWFSEADTPASYGVPPYVPGTSAFYTAGGVFKVPNGAKYLFVYAGSASAYASFPSYLAVSLDYAGMPDIVRENGYEKCRRVMFQMGSTTRAENDESYKPLVLLHYSDIHGSTICQERINDFRNYFKDYINDTIQTGDLVESYWGSNSAFGDESDPDNPCKDILCVIGNHDTASKSGGTFYWHTYQGKQSYDRYFAPWIANWNVAQPEDAADNGYCFYYKDYTDSKIRLVVIDAFDTDDSYQATQLSWFEGVLADARTNGLSVIIASHFRIKCESLLTSPFTMPGAAVENPDSSVCNDPFIPIVKNFIDAGGELVCWITGHSHYDAVSKTSEANGSQVNICIGNAGRFYTVDNVLWETNSRINVEPNDWKTFDLFNIMAVDTVYKTIVLFRIGSNWDKMGRRVETCCIKYNTGEILYP